MEKHPMLKKHGLSGFNKPKMTPSHPTKKAIVLAKSGGQTKLIRFGDQKMGHNYSPEARKAFKSRHAKNIARGPLSAAYWADKFLWGGKGESMKAPPKGQQLVRGEPIKGWQKEKESNSSAHGGGLVHHSSHHKGQHFGLFHEGD